MAIGDVRLFSALIAGFSPTTINPTTAGWTLLTGTSNLGQDATHLLVVDNGLMRYWVNKNATGGNAAGFVFFNGTAWIPYFADDGAARGDTPTVAAIRRNDAKEVQFTYTATNTLNGGTYTVLAILKRGVPFVIYRILASTVTVASYAPTGSQTQLAFLGATPKPLDVFGANNYIDGGGGSAGNFVVAPDPDNGIDVFIAASVNSTTGANNLQAYGGTALNWLGSASVNGVYAVGFMPRTYGLGNGGGANVGNGAYGQLREAEDNYTAAGGASLSVSADANCSGGKRLDFATPANGHKATFSINFPSPGIYYLMTATLQNGASGTHRLVVDGVNGATTTIPNTGLNTVGAHVAHGPFTIATAGNKTVTYEIVAVGDATGVFIDHISIFPYEATGSTPATQIFPRGLAQSLLRIVTPT